MIDTANDSVTISADKDITLVGAERQDHAHREDDRGQSDGGRQDQRGADGMTVHADGDVFVSGKTVNLN